MKPLYKDEQDIVDLASDIDDSDVCFYPEKSDTSDRFLASLRKKGLNQRERPDFEDAQGSLLIEVMRVDDHPRPGKKDKTRARESDVLRELESIGLETHPEAKLIALVSSGLPTDQDHNYRAYVSHFTRTVSKHGQNADAYRAERPGYDLAFLVLDESTAYFEAAGKAGPGEWGRPHFWFADSAFADVVAQSGADCVIWLSPYKMLRTAATGAFPLPTMTIIDVALMARKEHTLYDEDCMVSAEA